MFRICGFFASFKYGMQAWELQEKALSFSDIDKKNYATCI